MFRRILRIILIWREFKRLDVRLELRAHNIKLPEISTYNICIVKRGRGLAECRLIEIKRQSIVVEKDLLVSGIIRCCLIESLISLRVNLYVVNASI